MIPLIPWEPHVFPQQIQLELKRRSKNRGFNPVNSANSDWGTGNDEEWMNYLGPMTAWVRVCSNGSGIEENNLPGFVFYGGKDFYTSYGFNDIYSSYGFNNIYSAKKTNPSIIGYTPGGQAHMIENDFSNEYPIHVPTPEIERITATIQKEILRRIDIEWVCFSFKQLQYMTPYFLVPGISMIIEWGWNHFNPASLIDLKDEEELKKLFNNPYPLYTKNILDSKGNYEVLFGIVTNFEWSIDGNKIRCKTEVTSKDRILAGQIVNSNMVLKNIEDNKTSKNESSIKLIKSIRNFVDNDIDKFKDLIVDDELTKGDSKDPKIDRILNPILDSNNNPLRPIIQYVKGNHPENYGEYLFGSFFGRYITKTKIESANIIKSGPMGGNSFERYEKVISSIEKQSEYKTNIVERKKSSVPTIYSTQIEQLPPKKIIETVNSNDDFDHQIEPQNFWMNMGLIVEIINYYSCQLDGVNNESLFRVDIDDCIIGAHPNLISTDGTVLLIPNALSPRYFFGNYGYSKFESPKSGDNDLYKSQMGSGSYLKEQSKVTEEVKNQKKSNVIANASMCWADYRLKNVCLPIGNHVQRDDINFIINRNRMMFLDSRNSTSIWEFPSMMDIKIIEGDNDERIYNAFFTGLLKNLYLNVNTFKQIVKESNTFEEIYNKIFDNIQRAAANFWDLRLVSSTGRYSTEGLATMKIVDNKMTQYTSNRGEIFTFDYYAADGLIQSINFRPMLSNAQAIRTIYAQTNSNNNKNVNITGENELLNYNFKDRLFNVESKKSTNPFLNDSFVTMMESLQSVKPISNQCYQVTILGSDGKEKICRLAIPPDYSDILSIILDDEDIEHNPRYTGIMPGIQAEFTIQGIAGIRTFALFRVRGLPKPYSEDDIIFRVVDVVDTVQNGQWITTIRAGVIPLRGYFRNHFGMSVPIKKS